MVDKIEGRYYRTGIENWAGESWFMTKKICYLVWYGLSNNNIQLETLKRNKIYKEQTLYSHYGLVRYDVTSL